MSDVETLNERDLNPHNSFYHSNENIPAAVAPPRKRRVKRSAAKPETSSTPSAHKVHPAINISMHNNHSHNHGVANNHVAPHHSHSFSESVEDRDPLKINAGYDPLWEETIAEPSVRTRSPDVCWDCNRTCYNCLSNCCYKCFSAPTSWFFAGIWACCFASLASCQVWCFTPCLRMMTWVLGMMQKCWGACLMCMCAPVCELYALRLSKINIKHNLRHYNYSSTGEAPGLLRV